MERRFGAAFRAPATENAHLRVGSMPILALLEKEAFDPETIEMLVQCFEGTLADLRLRTLTPSITLLVARRTIEIAKTGERDPVRLRQLVLESLQGPADRNSWYGRAWSVYRSGKLDNR